ncbi:hypothetical protein [Alicyclobacillus fodiniaquatilis]|uniref:Uncharacterized protein n=1 Tax=Alicyclobacillus fodiniaquatilis TaxID=1661150 RepID=A0ABW4JB07_9BACL
MAANDGGDPTGTLSVYSTDWSESNGTDLKNTMSGDEIGAKGQGAGVKFTASSPGGVNQQWVGGEFQHGGTVNFTADLSYNVPYTPVNATLSYSPQNTETVNASPGKQTYQNPCGSGEASWFLPGNNNESPGTWR